MNKYPNTLTDVKAFNVDGTWNGNSYTYKGLTFTCTSDNNDNIISITVNGTNEASRTDFTLGSVTLPAGSYIINGCPAPTSGKPYWIGSSASKFSDEVGNGSSFTLEEETTFSPPSQAGLIGIRIAASITCNNVVFKPMIRLATETDATFVPYSNICPISGHTGMTVNMSGKNLLPSTYSDYDTTTSPVYGFIPAIMPENVDAIMSFTDKDNSVDISGVYFGFAHNYHGGTPETFKWCINNGNVYADLSNKSSAGSGPVGTLCEGIIIFPKTEEAFNKIFSRYNVQVVLGSTATDYAPYTGNQISVNWEDEAGTVYGGYFTLNNDNSVDLTVLDELITLDGISNRLAGKLEETAYGAALFFNNLGVKTQFVNISGPFSNVLQFSFSGYAIMPLYSFPGNSGTNTTCCLILPSGTTVEEGNAWLQSMVAAGTPVQVRRKLVTPQNWHFDNIGQLKTFLGTNNTWSDTGDITELDYCADTKLYIDGKLAEIQATILENIGG